MISQFVVAMRRERDGRIATSHHVPLWGPCDVQVWQHRRKQEIKMKIYSFCIPLAQNKTVGASSGVGFLWLCHHSITPIHEFERNNKKKNKNE